jgi:O-acetyl-ADP-ribose deacetylase (regulator of RNase III)
MFDCEGTRDTMPIQLMKGDITAVEADAIVNAANSLLVVGGGVSGAVHHAGGSAIDEACRAWIDEHGPVPPGESAITTAGDLPARYVIHTVGPMWHGGTEGEPEQLASAYRSAIELADQHGLTSVAFPSISTGIFGYPAELAAPIAVESLRDAMRTTRAVLEAVLVLYDDESYAVHQRALDALYDA